MRDTDNMLALLESLMPPTAEDVSMKIASDFRRRRIEKNITRREIAAKSHVSLSNVARFEQTGRISLANLIDLAFALGYHSELQNIFSEPKYSTMDELQQIRANQHKKKAPGHKHLKNDVSNEKD